MRFTPPLDLEHRPHELGLIHLHTAHSVLNVRPGCDRLYYGDASGDYMLTVPTGTYTLDDINHYIYTFLLKQFKSEFAEKRHFFDLEADNVTQTCRVNTSFTLQFDGESSIGHVLGFTRTVKPTARDEYEVSDGEMTLLKDYSVFVSCNIIESGFINARRAHNLHQFHIEDPPGSVIAEKPSHVVYHRVNRNWIDEITVRLENEDGNLIPFRKKTPLRCMLVLRRSE